MHSHIEIIFPPNTKNINEAVEQILKPFDENVEENKNTFYDWYEIGGRWSGYKGKQDVMIVGELPKGFCAARVIVAVPNYDENGLEAATMLEDSYWNGVSWNDSKFDGKVSTAIKKNNEYYKNATNESEYRDKRTVNDEWISVTVDCHC